MGPLSWIIFGALAGWAAGAIAGNSRRQGCLTNIVVGIVGAFIGGAVYEFLTGDEFSMAFNLTSFVVAVIGALILLALVSAAGGNRRRRKR
jgi:uncharacterized membrane protein YeaQ/YmgE (transglycosylase-associated protein family)